MPSTITSTPPVIAAPKQQQLVTTMTTDTETTPLLQVGNVAAVALPPTIIAAEPATRRRDEDEDEDEDETENPDRPKGFKFAVVFTCLLLGEFVVGYVSPVSSWIE